MFFKILCFDCDWIFSAIFLFFFRNVLSYLLSYLFSFFFLFFFSLAVLRIGSTQYYVLLLEPGSVNFQNYDYFLFSAMAVLDRARCAILLLCFLVFFSITSTSLSPLRVFRNLCTAIFLEVSLSVYFFLYLRVHRNVIKSVFSFTALAYLVIRSKTKPNPAKYVTVDTGCLYCFFFLSFLFSRFFFSLADNTKNFDTESENKRVICFKYD